MNDKVAYRVHIKITVSPLSLPQKLRGKNTLKMQINNYKMTSQKQQHTDQDVPI